MMFNFTNYFDFFKVTNYHTLVLLRLSHMQQNLMNLCLYHKNIYYLI